MMKLRSSRLLFVIILIAAGLRFGGIGYHDAYTDEAIYAFRAIEMIDYDGSLVQTTPWQWLGTVPWWAHLSFHDHPLGFFLLQHLAIGLFGETVFAMRLPSVLAGIASVYLLYCIGKKLWNEETGLAAAALLSVQSYHLWVSRLGMQDSVVIFLLLADIYVLLHLREKPRLWLMLGALLGFGLATKYTTLVIFPIIALYLLLERHAFWRGKYFWYGALLFSLFSSPVWIYNLMLYHTRGHFDFQLSALFRQDVPEWQFRMGREQVGSLGNRFRNFFLALYYANSQIFNALAAVSAAAGVSLAKKVKDKRLLFVLATTIVMYLWFFVIGSTYRFVVMIVPFFVLLIGFAISHFRKIPLFSLLLAVELLFSVNTFFLHPSRGRPTVAYAQVNEETQNYGFNELDAYLSRLLEDRVSAVAGAATHPFLEEIQTRRLLEKKAAGARPAALVIVYDKNINFVSTLWIFNRRLLYDSYPVMSDVDFLAYTKGKMEAHYREQGVQDFIYIVSVSENVRRAPFERTSEGQPLLDYISQKGLQPVVIQNKAGEPAFWIYQF